MTCVRCKVPAQTVLESLRDPLHLCIYCSTLTRIEVERGFVQLETYLRKWAAFDSWLGDRRAAPAQRAH